MFGRFGGRLYRHRQAFVRLLRLTIFISAFCYIAYSLVKGDLGLEALARLSKKSSSLSKREAILNASCDELLRKTRLLRSPIDPDILEEQTKMVLGYALPGEKAFIFPESFS